MLSRRLESLGLQPGAPFSQAGAGVIELAPAARIASLRLTTTPENWRQALAIAEQELRRAVEHGFTAEELDQELAIFRSDLQTAAAGAGTRESSTLAEQLLNAISDHDVFTSPATDLALVDQLTRDLKPADVDRALREVLGGQEPLIFVTSPVEVADARAEILATYQASRAVPVAAQADRSVGAFAYTDFGKPSGVVSTEEIADLGITESSSRTAWSSTSSRPSSRPARSRSRFGSAAGGSACRRMSQGSICWRGVDSSMAASADTRWTSCIASWLPISWGSI